MALGVRLGANEGQMRDCILNRLYHLPQKFVIVFILMVMEGVN